MKIGITGPFPDINFGDYAMLVNNIYDMGIKNITLFSYNKEFIKQIKKDYLDDCFIKIAKVDLQKEIIREKDPFTAVFKQMNIQTEQIDYYETPVEILLMCNNYNEIFEEISFLDMIVVNGGGYFNELWYLPHRKAKLFKIIIPILIANQQNKKIVFTGNGFGPFNKCAEFFACFFNSLNNVVFCTRDNLYSRMYLKQLRVDESKIIQIPDDLLFINDKIKCREKRVNIRFKDYIVLELYYPLEYLEENKYKLVDFSNKLYKKYGLNIVFLPFDFNYGGLQQARYLKSILNHFEYYDIEKVGYLPIEDAVEIIKNSKIVISMRYHALVLALGNKIPVLNVLRDVCGDKRYYYNKSSGILRDTLNNTNFNEMDYLKTNIWDTFEEVINKFDIIREKQIRNYNTRYTENMLGLENNRIQYFKKHFNI